MATSREHREKITAVQDQIGSLEDAVNTLNGKIEAAQAVKDKLINQSVELGGVPDTDTANVEIYRLRERMGDGERVREGLKAKLDQALEEYRGHLVERAQLEVDRSKKEIRQTLELIANFRVELTRLSMTLRGTDWSGNAMSGPNELGPSKPLVFEYSSVPVPQAVEVQPPPLNYNPKDFMRLSREIGGALKELRGVEKMSADQVLALALKSS